MLNNFKTQELAWKANLHHLNTESCRKFAELVIAENKRQESEKPLNKMTGRDLSDYKKGTRVKYFTETRKVLQARSSMTDGYGTMIKTPIIGLSVYEWTVQVMNINSM